MKCWRFSLMVAPCSGGPPPATTRTGLPQVWASMQKKVQHLHRLALGVAVLAVAGKHVVIGGDAREEGGRRLFALPWCGTFRRSTCRVSPAVTTPTSASPSSILSPRASPVSSIVFPSARPGRRRCSDSAPSCRRRRRARRVATVPSLQLLSQSWCFRCSAMSSGCIGPATVRDSTSSPPPSGGGKNQLPIDFGLRAIVSASVWLRRREPCSMLASTLRSPRPSLRPLVVRIEFASVGSSPPGAAVKGP